jgi:hypothetical protein
MTSQDGFKQLMRDTLVPALRELGFRGSAARALWYSDGEYGGSLWTQKSVTIRTSLDSPST